MSVIIESRHEDTASRLTCRYNRLWETERWWKVWKKRLVVNVFKKLSLHECNNCRSDFTTSH